MTRSEVVLLLTTMSAFVPTLFIPILPLSDRVRENRLPADSELFKKFASVKANEETETKTECPDKLSYTYNMPWPDNPNDTFCSPAGTVL